MFMCYNAIPTQKPQGEDMVGKIDVSTRVVIDPETTKSINLAELLGKLGLAPYEITAIHHGEIPGQELPGPVCKVMDKNGRHSGYHPVAYFTPA